ncbi:phosphoserine phosphatase SerB [Shewanella intestini]|uniref:Phosphoserine phosphatase n=1 Tax=Shewanella intestini TaxID=2017544 RepID=A0ABS5HY01_9GAMM|nr:MULTISPECIES: phosphoserine phosphatase SerB [Shewanella]MBR9726486.1 phosphoserine phosphatase SerB [Shewanella intestini]MRG34948.1 phosphoserine phosphatase SerB [Shewanella sp. XMDDZSB0408]
MLNPVAIVNWLSAGTSAVQPHANGQFIRYHESDYQAYVQDELAQRLRVVFAPCAQTEVDSWLAKLSGDIYICALTRSNDYLGLELVLATSNETIFDTFPSTIFAEYFWVTTELASLHMPGLLVMDMDSTAIEIECIDELAAMAGVGDAVAGITAKAMRGELDFEQSLRARVAKLKGANANIITQLCDQLPIMPGLAEALAQLQQYQWKLVVASGGFTPFVNDLKQKLSLDAAFANELVIEQNTLKGEVCGDVVDAQYKADVIKHCAKQWQITQNQTVAIGDGANDIPMILTASLGLAFHAKPKLIEHADIAINQLDMRALVFCLQG